MHLLLTPECNRDTFRRTLRAHWLLGIRRNSLLSRYLAIHRAGHPRGSFPSRSERSTGEEAPGWHTALAGRNAAKPSQATGLTHQPPSNCEDAGRVVPIQWNEWVDSLFPLKVPNLLCGRMD
jgi:hypothetical protein